MFLSLGWAQPNLPSQKHFLFSFFTESEGVFKIFHEFGGKRQNRYR